MKKSVRGVIVASAIVSLFALSACGGSSDSEGSGSGDSDSASSAKGAAIKVGFIGSTSGALASSTGKADETIKAWESSVNDNGGLNGAPVKVFVKDDEGDPVKALAAAKELVEKDGVVAVVGEASTVVGSFADYLQSKNVPAVGGATTDPPFESNPLFFATGGGIDISSWAFAKVGKDSGGHFGMIYCAEAPVCQTSSDNAEKAAKIQGVDFTSLKVTATAPSYTAQCLKLKDAGVTGMVPALDPVTAGRVLADCAKVGFKPKLANAGGTVSPTILRDKNFEGDKIIQANASFSDDSIEGTKTMIDTLNKYQPGVVDSDQFTYWVQNTWNGGKLFELAAKNANLTAKSTSADVLDGLYKIDGETLGGVTPPLKFEKGKTSLSPCYFELTITDGELVADSEEATCMTDDEVAAMNK